MADIDFTLTEPLAELIEQAFGQPQSLRTWFELRLPGANSYDVLLITAGFRDQIVALFGWARANGRNAALLQALADDPPAGGQSLPKVIQVLTGGVIKAAQPAQQFNRQLFVTTGRPLVDRAPLRAQVDNFEGAAPGPDSVLIVEGPRRAGKSHGLRYAKRCAPSQRFIPVDIADWTGEKSLDAATLVRAMCRQTEGEPGDVQGYDPTKEAQSVPKLVAWLGNRLGEMAANQGGPIWVIVDHCDRAALSDAARDLLKKLVEKIGNLDLHGVRLILAGFERAKLQPPLSNQTRHDVTSLPDQAQIRQWCSDVAMEAGKECPAPAMDGYVQEVVPPGDGDDPSALLEDRLMSVYRKIRALR